MNILRIKTPPDVICNMAPAEKTYPLNMKNWKNHESPLNFGFTGHDVMTHCLFIFFVRFLILTCDFLQLIIAFVMKHWIDVNRDCDDILNLRMFVSYLRYRARQMLQCLTGLYDQRPVKLLEVLNEEPYMLDRICDNNLVLVAILQSWLIAYFSYLFNVCCVNNRNAELCWATGVTYWRWRNGVHWVPINL